MVQLRTLEGHTDSVYSIAFSPDGTLLASGSVDNTVRLWRVSDGRLLRTLEKHEDKVYSVAFSPDGTLLASGSVDNTVRLWRVSDGRLLRTLEGHEDEVWSVVFSPDGTLLASGSLDGRVGVWQVSDGRLLYKLAEQGGALSVAFSPDGTLLASGSADNTVQIWQVSTGKRLRTLEGHTGKVYALAFSPDGTLLASGSMDNTVRIWRVSDGKLLHTLIGHGDDVYGLAFSPDGALLASASADNTVRIWRVSDGKLLHTLEGRASVYSIAFSPDGTLLASGLGDSTVRLWGMASSAPPVKGAQEASPTSAGTPPVTPPTLGRPRPTVSWGRTYGGTNGGCNANTIAPTLDGGYVVAGRIGSFGGPGKKDVWVLKLDGWGNVQWQKTYGGPKPDEATAIVLTPDGGYVVAGWTWSFGAGWGDVWVLKLDGRGNVQWQKTYGGPDEDRANAIALTSDGGYVVAGETGSFGAGEKDVWVLKLDGQGDVQWEKTYGGPNDDEANAIVPTSDGGYVVAGWTKSFGAGKEDVWVLKLDRRGNVQWQKTYGGPDEDRANAIALTSDGGYVVAGKTWSFGAGGEVWVLKLDGQGNVQRKKTYGRTGDDEANAIALTSDGGYVVGGKTCSFECNAWVLKLDGQGDVQWQKTYGGTDNHFAQAIAPTSDGGYVVAGWTLPRWSSEERDVWVLKLGADGSIRGCPSGLVRDSAASVTSTAVRPRNSSALVRTSFASVRASSATVETTSVSPTPVCRGE
jgi:uncharacterized delta-60 repeat protein